MKLVSIRCSEAPLGCVIGGEVLSLSRAGLNAPRSMTALLAGGPSALSALGAVVRDATRDEGALAALRKGGALTPFESTELDAPIQPRLVLCTGRAYRSHREEMGIGHLPAGKPGAFIKNANAVTGPDAPIRIPPNAPDMIDFEGEIAAVFHTECHRVSPERAWDFVAGLTLSNDVSARNWVAQAGRTGNTAPNILGKQFPTFFPLGPCIATLDEFEDRDAVTMTTHVSGELMQSCTTADLIWPAAELISHYSQFYMIRPGDVVTFGTPAGVGYGRSPQRFLAEGDMVTVASPAIGELTNKLEAVEPNAQALGIVGQTEEAQ